MFIVRPFAICFLVGTILFPFILSLVYKFFIVYQGAVWRRIRHPDA